MLILIPILQMIPEGLHGLGELALLTSNAVLIWRVRHIEKELGKIRDDFYRPNLPADP